MQRLLLVCSLMLFIEAAPAASGVPAPATTLLPLSSSTSASAVRFPRPRFRESRGTMGFVYGLVLGPVGYYGVQLFSRHNEMKRYQAGKGFKAWIYIVISCGLLAAAVATKSNGNEFFSSLLNSLWQSY